jgi:hypothetical protein
VFSWEPLTVVPNAKVHVPSCMIPCYLNANRGLNEVVFFFEV